MTRALALTLCVMLASCVASASDELPMPAALFHTADLAPYAGTLRPMVVTLALDTEDRTVAICDALTKANSLTCATYDEAGRRACVIHMPLPRHHRDAVWTAEAYHEFIHCQDGDWHP